MSARLQSGHHRGRRGRAGRLGAAIGVAVAAAVTAATLAAQNQPPSTASSEALPFQMAITREMAAARVQAILDHLPYVPGETLVKFRDGFDAGEQRRALSAVRGGATTIQWIGDTLLVHNDREPNAEVMADVLARQPEVEWAEPNYLSHLHLVPNDPSFSLQWNLNLINMPAAWDISHGGSSTVTVAVVDTGVNTVSRSYAFSLWNGTAFTTSTVPFAPDPDIASTRVASGRDFAFWDGPVLDMVGHGTHVAGTILEETNNNLAFAGIAYNARLLPVKVCYGYWEIQIVMASLNLPGFADPDDGGCATSDVIAGIRYAADNGAQIINLSLGGPGQSTAELDAIRYAVEKGAFVAMAAGNEFDSGNPPEYPAAFAPQIDGAMSVGAVGRSRRRAYYSNTGSYIEIAAPGGDFRADGLSGVIYQVGLVATDSEPTLVRVMPRFDRYQELALQGTSMAAPHVAGVAALLYAQGLTNPAVIEAAIRKFAVDLGSPGKDDEYGYGLVDARAALRGLGVAK